jgi:thymidine phosphorylase
VIPAETIRRKRDGLALSPPQIADFVQGLVDGRWGDAQAAALAMAIVWRGMDSAETAELTRAMTRSGTVLRWPRGAAQGPVLDKHSTGGVGDKVSLILAPQAATSGAVVPMISGRGLGHTGGTLDKLEALPGYRVMADEADLRACVQAAGCAIVGAGQALAPADRRLYAIRDLTATVESLPLIIASILSKKLAAGLHGLVMDVKGGSGAFMADAGRAHELAEGLVAVARDAGLPTVALVTDMDQPLGCTAGNALEVAEAMAVLAGPGSPAALAVPGLSGPGTQRLRELTLRLAAELIRLGGLEPDLAAAQARAQLALDSGEAAQRWARMVAQRGGPADVWRDGGLKPAPVCRDVPALQDGTVTRIDTRALGLAVVQLGGGRARAGDSVDPRVGLSGLVGLGEQRQRGAPLAWVHAADTASAEAAVRAVQQACQLATAGTATPPAPLIQAVVG